MNKLEFIRDYTNNDVEIEEKKIDFLNDESRLRGYMGPRCCGKTYLLYQDLAYNVATNVGHYIVIAPNYPALRIISQHIKECFEQFMITPKEVSSPTSLELSFHNGSVITFMSGSNDLSSRLRGYRLNGAYIDDIEHIKGYKSVLEVLDKSALNKPSISVFGRENVSAAAYLEKIGYSLTILDVMR